MGGQWRREWTLGRTHPKTTWRSVSAAHIHHQNWWPPRCGRTSRDWRTNMGHPCCWGQDAHHFLDCTDPASESFFCFCYFRDFRLFKGDQGTKHFFIVVLNAYSLFLLYIVYIDTHVYAYLSYLCMLLYIYQCAGCGLGNNSTFIYV